MIFYLSGGRNTIYGSRKLRQCVIVLEQRLDHTKLNRPRLARDLSLNLFSRNTIQVVLASYQFEDSGHITSSRPTTNITISAQLNIRGQTNVIILAGIEHPITSNNSWRFGHTPSNPDR